MPRHSSRSDKRAPYYRGEKGLTVLLGGSATGSQLPPALYLSTHPGVMGIPLPLDQLGLQQFQNSKERAGSQAVGLGGSWLTIIELPASLVEWM